MSSNLKKRTLTSILLFSLLIVMFLYTYVMIISLIIIAIISWIEFYALISKIIKKNHLIDKFLRFLYKTLSLFYLSGLVYLFFAIESGYSNLKI
jgi:phosphatidate cytidylyltransferase